MKRLAPAVLAVVLAAALLPAAERQNAPERFTLATGTPCIYQKDAVSPTTVVGLFIGGGKSAVPPGLDGLAAVATRILLEIPDDSKVRDLMAQATRLSYVCLEDFSVILVECLTENLEEALKVAAKIIQDPLVSGLRVGRAKELMTANAKIEDDDAVAAGRNAALRALFGGRGYGSTLYGTEAGLKAIDRKDVLAFIRRFVVKPNVFFLVETDLERDPLRRLLEAAFDAFPEGPAVEVPRQEPVLPDDRDVLVVKDAKQSYIGRAYALPRAGLKDMAQGYLLETLLGKGPGSRLWTLRADERLAYGVDADLTWMKSAGVLIAYLETGRAKGPEAGAALDRVLSGLREDGVTEEELAATQTMARGRFLRATEAKSPRLRTLGLFEVLGLGTGSSSGFLEALRGVTREDLNAFIRSALDPDRAVRVAVGPGPSGKVNGVALPEFGADDRHPPGIGDRPERRGNGRLGVEREPRPGPVPAADGQGHADQVLIAPSPEELHQVEGETKGYDRFLAGSRDLDGAVDIPCDRRIVVDEQAALEAGQRAGRLARPLGAVVGVDGQDVHDEFDGQLLRVIGLGDLQDVRGAEIAQLRFIADIEPQEPEFPDAPDLEFQPLQVRYDRGPIGQCGAAAEGQDSGQAQGGNGMADRVSHGRLLSRAFMCFIGPGWENVNAPGGGGGIDSFLTVS